jgi:RNA polymerase sigma-70 factor (ECF subfamily)
MSAAAEPDDALIRRIRAGEADAWTGLIERFEGRLLAFVGCRLPDRSAAEDVVQETFIGLLTSLPNYDRRRSLEAYLFTIAAHKLIDQLRREGRRPKLPLVPPGAVTSQVDFPSRARPASSLVRSGERRRLEETALVTALAEQIDHSRRRGQWEKLQCAELLFVRGWSNQETARRLGISEQAVANVKFEFLARLRSSVRDQDLSEDVFPELYAPP